jgi:hypothetical protein
MVAGSVASTFHGEPRATQDIDFVIDPNADALRTFVSGLDSERYYVGDADNALANRDQFNIIDTVTGWKVDLIIRKDRPFSRSEFDRRIRSRIAGVPVAVATVEDTILAKLEWSKRGGSERQLRDVVGMIAVAGTGLDLAYLTHWADELGLRSQFEAAQVLAEER